MSIFDRADEMFFDLFKAVYADDLAEARATLNMMQAIGIRSDRIIKARAISEPLPPAPPLAKPIPLPQPGADPMVVFGGPGKREVFGNVKPAKRKRARKSS